MLHIKYYKCKMFCKIIGAFDKLNLQRYED
jgi:hypothetical protein